MPLSTLVRAGTSAPARQPAPPAPAPPHAMPSAFTAPDPPTLQVVRNVRDFAHADVVHELALMRLAAREACERAVTTLLEAFARDVLARELALAPAEIDTLVRELLATAAASEPVEIAVSVADRERVHAALPIRVDETLVAGDLVVEVRDGALVSTFAFRLEDALARVACSVRV